MLTTELPGVEPTDVEIEVEGNALSVKGAKKLEREPEDERVRIRERRSLSEGLVQRTKATVLGTDRVRPG